MIRRSAAVVIAVTLGQLAAGRRSGWTEDQELVIRALRRSAESLHYADMDDLSAYLAELSPDQMRGVVSNVKGIFHEMLIKRAEDADGDEVTAALFEATNHPGADIEFLVDGEVIREVQVKAVQSPAAIIEHFSRYPETEVMATREVTALLDGAFGSRLHDSGFSNAEITKETRETLEELAGENIGDFLSDGALTSPLLGGAIVARAILAGGQASRENARSFIELAGIGVGTAVTVEAVLGLL